MRPIRIISFVFITLFHYLLSLQAAVGATIEETLPGGLTASADYRPGADNKPAILLIHGFLTVHSFSLIQKIADDLSDNDYTILAPTLTLGISKRGESLPCDALHLHSMRDDLDEIRGWVKWLVKRGHNNIILAGHSTGALQILLMLHDKPMQEISKLIAISMIPLENNNRSAFEASIKRANAMIAAKDQSIGRFTISYCDNSFIAPAEQYLSYANMHSDIFLNTIKNDKFNVKVILGSEDADVSRGWLDKLDRLGFETVVIPGANHFFSHGHEFELYETLIDLLEDG